MFVGGAEVPPASLLASDPTRAAIVTPPGPPGFVDVKIRDDATAKERVLKNGFYYDAFVVQPSSGATSGGTRITITGNGTSWAPGTKASVDGKACTDVVVSSPTKLECVTPAGTAGAKDVTVTTLGGKSLQAREAFTYSDSADGYRGGLSGNTFTNRVKVVAIDKLTGQPIPGAYAIAGSALPGAIVQKTSASGAAELTLDPDAGPLPDKITVTVAAECHQPITFVDVKVDSVTAYLDVVFDPSCAEGDPPSVGGAGGVYGGLIEGTLVFPGGQEFEQVGWSTVPQPTRPTERRAAYVFEAASSPDADFDLPSAASAITPDDITGSGYTYSVVVYPGNATIYVVAGLEDRSETPVKFVPYSMGVARGIGVPAQTRVTGVDIAMDVLFDHQVVLAPQPPVPGPRGPDRIQARVATTLGAEGFAVFPRGTRVVALPSTGTIPFVGVPSLDKALGGEQYVVGAVAATGSELQNPESVVSRIRTTNANTPITVGGFLGVPVPVEPLAGAWSGAHVAFGGAAGPVDLSVTTISSGGGLVTWTIVAPGGTTSFDVPDISTLPATKILSLVRGPIKTTFNVARIDAFDYGRLRTGQMTTSGWTAWASDVMNGVY